MTGDGEVRWKNSRRRESRRDTREKKDDEREKRSKTEWRENRGEREQKEIPNGMLVEIEPEEERQRKKKDILETAGRCKSDRRYTIETGVTLKEREVRGERDERKTRREKRDKVIEHHRHD